ncbi:MAG: hypothetical protein B6D45_03255, partial [Ignavibacteriales bacterium UTCHB3]
QTQCFNHKKKQCHKQKQKVRYLKPLDNICASLMKWIWMRIRGKQQELQKSFGITDGLYNKFFYKPTNAEKYSLNKRKIFAAG